MRKFISVLAAAAILAGSALAQDREKELGRIQAASNVLNEIQAAPDKGIPAEIMESADCVAVIPSMLKGGFVVGGNYGKGIATCRHGEQWSAPAPIRIEGGSWGLQIGGQAVDLIMLVMNQKGMDQLLQSKFKVGADVSAAAGPVGRHVEGTTDWKMRAEVLTYSRARGAFAGITLNGAVIRQDEDDTVALYGRMIPFTQILSGSVPAPAGTQTFLADVSKYFRAAQTGTVAATTGTAAPVQSGTTAVPGSTATGSTGTGGTVARNSTPTGTATPPSSAAGASSTAPATPPRAPEGAVAASQSAPAATAGTAGAATSSAPVGASQETVQGAPGSVAGTGATRPGVSSSGVASEEPAAPTSSAPANTDTSAASPSGANMTPADVKSSIEKALRDRPGLSSGGVIVNVTESKVELTGTVPSEADKETVRKVAEQNAAGRKVEDAGLMVK